MTDPTSIARTTRLIRAAHAGDERATDELFGVLYEQLRRLAAKFMAAEREQHSLQPTALINEAWLRLIDLGDEPIDGKKHFFRIAARAMRRVLVDHARRRNARSPEKRRSLGDVVSEQGLDDAELIGLHDALERLEQIDSQLARIVELRFFAGLSHAEVAENLGVSLRSVERLWRLARAWLNDQL